MAREKSWKVQGESERELCVQGDSLPLASSSKRQLLSAPRPCLPAWPPVGSPLQRVLGHQVAETRPLPPCTVKAVLAALFPRLTLEPDLTSKDTAHPSSHMTWVSECPLLGRAVQDGGGRGAEAQSIAPPPSPCGSAPSGLGWWEVMRRGLPWLFSTPTTGPPVLLHAPCPDLTTSRPRTQKLAPGQGVPPGPACTPSGDPGFAGFRRTSGSPPHWVVLGSPHPGESTCLP